MLSTSSVLGTTWTPTTRSRLGFSLTSTSRVRDLKKPLPASEATEAGSNCGPQEGNGVAVSVAVGESFGVLDGVALGVAVAVGVLVGVADEVGVLDGVFVVVEAGVFVGVAVGVLVDEGV